MVHQDTNLHCQTITCPLIHFWACRLPIKDKRAECLPHFQKWPTSLLTISSRVGYPSWALKVCQLGLRLPMAFKSSYHLQPFGYPSWTLGVTTTNGLQVLLPPAAVVVTQAGCWRGISWGHDYKMAFNSFICSRVGYPSWTLNGRQLG